MIRSGSIKRALVVNPEICSAHLEWRDRDCHFIFGDVATAVLIERADLAKGPHFLIRSTRCATQFSNNIRNNNGFLRRTRKGHMEDRRDMQFMQNGRKVFKEVLPLVSKHIAGHMADDGVKAGDLKRLWLHQANKTMNDYIGRRVLGRDPEPGEQPNILQDYANTSSAGSIIAFSKYSEDMAPGDLGLICSFGAGYSVGSVIVDDGSAIVVGASEGGFIASNLAVHRPERVDRLILLGPMGYAGATGAVLRIMGAQFMPLGPVQDATFRWAFSDAPAVIAEFNEWFRLLMSDAFPVKVAPFPLPVEERRSIAAPTLFVFGTRDNLVGDPEAARALVSDMPDASVAVVEAGHLMAVERPAEIEALILDFLAETR
jgi:hypothetical protein